MPKKYNLVLPDVHVPGHRRKVSFGTREEALDYLMQWYPSALAALLLPLLQVERRQLFELETDAPLVCVSCLTPPEREWIADPDNMALVEVEVDCCDRCQTIFMSEGWEVGT